MRYNRPLPDSYWVMTGALGDGYLLAGEYPGARRPEAARRKLTSLLEAGITYFIDLTTEADGLRAYTALLEDVAGQQGIDAGYRRLPIPDLGVPTVAEMVVILDAIDAALADEQVVYVHCWGGIGRTGTVVGCYLVRHGRTPEEALRALQKWRRDTPNGWRASPETEAQREMIAAWQEPASP